MSFKVPNQYRVRNHKYLGSEDSIGNCGAFNIPFESRELFVIANDGEFAGWEHVSVSTNGRCPNWKEMCFVKSLFWDDEDCVIQYHPPKSTYVNDHKFVLHMWRPTREQIPMPPLILV